MAERRMFAKTIIDSDAFLDMPQTAQLLYFHLAMRADDDGFINKPKTVMRMVGSRDDDLACLAAKKFIIPFESGVVVIKHWRIHNYIKNDRYIETKYKAEKDMLETDENKAYRLPVSIPVPEWNQSGTTMEPQVRVRDRVRLELGKDSIDKDICVPDGTKKQRFVPPTIEEIQAYVTEKSMNVDAEKFWNFYESKGWLVGKSPMKSWKAACGTWNLKDKPPNKVLPHDPELDKYDLMYEEKP
jgi:hypothetical protein